MALLQINLLGGVEIIASGALVPIPSRKAGALLGYLALNSRRAVARSKLASLLWDGHFEEQARASLRQVLVTLRRVLPRSEEVITADRDDIGIRPGAFTTDVGECDQLLQAHEPVNLLRAAALYRGELLDGVGATSMAFEAWLTGERQRLKSQAMAAMTAMLEIGGRERIDSAIALALRILAIDPLEENAHRTVMRCYARQGRRSDALRQYDRCRIALWKEVGAAPEGETERLQRDIRRHASHM